MVGLHTAPRGLRTPTLRSTSEIRPQVEQARPGFEPTSLGECRVQAAAGRWLRLPVAGAEAQVGAAELARCEHCSGAEAAVEAAVAAGTSQIRPRWRRRKRKTLFFISL
mmetsp:Transcript_39746/g.84991  ORF Transcript_39746/g.84991 Transcript_39746/m.84991 type:complete len:109 (+) Transcript_39746:429-755(+)